MDQDLTTLGSVQTQGGKRQSMSPKARNLSIRQEKTDRYRQTGEYKETMRLYQST